VAPVAHWNTGDGEIPLLDFEAGEESKAYVGSAVYMRFVVIERIWVIVEDGGRVGRLDLRWRLGCDMLCWKIFGRLSIGNSMLGKL
jgi:hypothetical protein